MILSLIRHSEVVVDPSVNPQSWNLSTRGLAAAKELALQSRWKNLDRLVSSTEQKAVSTGECLATTSGVKLEISPNLDEIKRPSFQRDYINTVAKVFDLENNSIDGWETAAHALGRVKSFISSLGLNPQENHVALVGHGILWALLRAWLLGESHVDVSDWRAILMPDVSTWSITSSGVVLVSDFSGINARSRRPGQESWQETTGGV